MTRVTTHSTRVEGEGRTTDRHDRPPTADRPTRPTRLTTIATNRRHNRRMLTLTTVNIFQRVRPSWLRRETCQTWRPQLQYGLSYSIAGRLSRWSCWSRIDFCCCDLPARRSRLTCSPAPDIAPGMAQAWPQASRGSGADGADRRSGERYVLNSPARSCS